ncbi:hypothetical protein BC936DRAFT_142769, partial [Jimgerdemannia flammicorona]
MSHSLDFERSTIAGTKYGVAKADIVGVKVLDCDGSETTSGVISGVDCIYNLLSYDCSDITSVNVTS